MNPDPTSLDQLHDIIVPDPVPWWPPAPAWLWILGFALLLLAGLILRAFAHWQLNRYRREALAELGALRLRLKQADQRASALLELAGLLKRTALSAFPREEVASLTGLPWFAFLDRTGEQTTFGAGTGAALDNAIHDPARAADLGEQELDKLMAQARRWIKSHRVGVANPKRSRLDPNHPPRDKPPRPLETPC